jgi:hypothetical protein
MKTSELIALISSDKTLLPSPWRALLLGMAPGVVLAVSVFVLAVGLRADIAQVWGSARFTFKVLVNLALLIAALGLILRLARPGGRSGPWSIALMCLALVMLAAIGFELVALPSANWSAATLGQNSTWCLIVIPLLALAPLATALQALRSAAPDQPAMAGAVTGLLSASVASCLYALHCTDDSPLFVALWYGLAIAAVTLIGAVIGSRVLRW